jgi:DNA mismatch repair protein MutL
VTGQSESAASVPRIRPLPERLINKIAAGEVVERPASVVKELTENAIDAGATRIEIIIEKSGSKLIKIVDNGRGIPEDQIEIAFSRHATSKISNFADLDNIITYGFRGEALPSIASVSRMRMVSRASGEAVGIEILCEGGVLQSKEPASSPPGTTVEVENLFYNTPARRKFLKAETTEARHISRVAMALALGRYDIGLSYTLNGRSIFALPPGQELRERVSSLLALGKSVVGVIGQTDSVKIEGFIGTPEMAQNQRWGHFIFINGRFIHSTTLSHALSAGYGELLPKGLFPVGALLLTVDPGEIDVNVHPAKTEVRLSRERDIHDAIMHLVKESLRRDSIIPVFKPAEDPASTHSHNAAAGNFAHPRSSQSAVIPGIGANQSGNRQFLADLYRPPSLDSMSPMPDVVHVDTRTGEIIESGANRPHASSQPTDETRQMPPVHAGPSDGIRLVGRFSDLYLVLQAGDDLYIVDQHTAHERVLYEEILKRIESHSVVGQMLLLPVQVDLNPEQLAVFDEALPLLNQSGFSVTHFGGRMINIESVPTILARKSPEKMILKLIDDLSSLRKAGQDMKKAMAQSIACRGAVMSGDRLTDNEAVGLLIRPLQCENKYSCPHGRPTFIRISRPDLDKQFGRA